MLILNRNLTIPADELQFSYSRSSGPGGQNVNKVNSKATLRWNVEQSSVLPADLKRRFKRQQSHRINQQGELVISSQRHREQPRNARDCLEKLRAMLLEAMQPVKSRKETKVPRGVRQRRLREKKQQAEKKQRRKSPRLDD